MNRNSYLVQLFRNNKWLFLLIVGFFTIQIFINFKRGLTAAPFLHYGMYSGSFSIPDTMTAFKIYVNNKVLSLNGNFPEVNDQILVPLKSYLNLPITGNSLYHSHINKYLGILKIPAEEKKYVPDISQLEFITWYKHKLELLTENKINKLEILEIKNVIEKGQMISIDSTKILSWN